MSEYECFLITVLEGERLLKCALKVKRTLIKNDLWEYPMEPENKEFLHNLLPLHVRNCGPIVDVENLFEVEMIG